MDLPSRAYIILDADVAARRGWELPALVEACLQGGGRLFQVRAKHAASREMLEICQVVVRRAQPLGGMVIVNDRADVARLAGAAGVHVGQDDLPPSDARRILGPGRLVGLSTHSTGQLAAAWGEPIDYVAIGPVFATGTKETGYPPVGLDLVREAARLAGERPVVAIGGITLERAPAVLDAGASAVAVISDLLATGDPAGRTRAFIEALDGRD